MLAATGFGIAKVAMVANTIIKQPVEKQRNTLKVFGIITGVVFMSTVISIKFYQRSKARRYRDEKIAYAEEFVIKKEAENRYGRASKHMRNKPQMDSVNEEGQEMDPHHIVGNTMPWNEYYNQKFPLVCFDFPTIISDFLVDCPEGYEEALIAHLTTALGAICFSRVQSEYLDGKYHRPNLQTIIEALAGTGKGYFQEVHNKLLQRRIARDSAHLEKFDEIKPILQTIGMAVSPSRYLDILAFNRGVHSFAFEPEIQTVNEALRNQNGIEIDLLRRAFDNDTTWRMNKDKNAPQGAFETCLNFTFTGTPDRVNNFIKIKDGIEAGNASRICWCVIPPSGKDLPDRNYPEPDVMNEIHDYIDAYADQYSYHITDEGTFEPAPLYTIDLSYVNVELKKWCENQYLLGQEEENQARIGARGRMAAIAFHFAIVFHMLWNQPKSKETRQSVLNLTIYMANYFMERYLHKFGYIQNQNHAKFMAQELGSVDCGLIKQSFEQPDNAEPKKSKDYEVEWNRLKEQGLSYKEIADRYDGFNIEQVKGVIRRYRKNNHLPPLPKEK